MISREEEMRRVAEYRSRASHGDADGMPGYGRPPRDLRNPGMYGVENLADVPEEQGGSKK